MAVDFDYERGPLRGDVSRLQESSEQLRINKQGVALIIAPSLLYVMVPCRSGKGTDVASTEFTAKQRSA